MDVLLKKMSKDWAVKMKSFLLKTDTEEIT